MKQFVVEFLQTRLPPHYFYHNVNHTLDVVQNVLEIGKQEGCSEEELRLLYAAALWHDTGFVETYTDHEAASCRLAATYLPKYGYSELETDKICTLIMATKIPHAPADHLEEIMADADLEYLGKAAPGAKTNDLFRELQYVTPELEEAEWNQIQINFLRQHHYFTRFCQVHREPLKQAYLTSLLTTDGEP